MKYRSVKLLTLGQEYVITTILWCLAVGFVKAAIILEWTHIFIPRSTRNMFFWICYLLLSANACLYMATVIAINLSCIPRERIWRRWIPGTCFDIDSFNLSITSFHLVFDILLLLLPHKIIWKLSMSTRQRTGVSVVFSVGVLYVIPTSSPPPPFHPLFQILFLISEKCLTGVYHYSLCACAAGRVASAVDMSSSEDKSYAYSQFLLWGLGEATSTILVFCAPSIPIMLNRGGRASKVKMSTSWPAGQRRRLSEHPQRPWPRSAGNSTNGDDYRHMNEDSATQLDGVRQSYAGTGSIYDQDEQHPLERYLGILKTTDIEITTHTETDLPIMGHRKEQPHHPWRDSQASP